MFREMRRKDKALELSRVEKVLRETYYGVLGTLSENGYPYTTPLNYVFMDGKIYFHCATEGEKLDNIARMDKVTFNVVCDIEPLPATFDTNYKSVTIFGRAAEVVGAEKKEALMSFIHKYSPGFLEKGTMYVEKGSEKARVYKIEVEHMTGKYQE